MNVISYINGDARITDFPSCSARPLSLLVQSANDLLAGRDGYLSPENSILALDLAWQTVGTAGSPDSVVHAWIAELLTNPTWGMLAYAKITAHKAIIDIAELHRAAAEGAVPSVSDWEVASLAARAVAPSYKTSGLYALRAVYESTGRGNTQPMAEVVAVHALRAHQLASEGTMANRTVELTRHAIESWRHRAGLDSPGDISRHVRLQR
jgi:hypothetical protein